jgi:hypothetical protein
MKTNRESRTFMVNGTESYTYNTTIDEKEIGEHTFDPTNRRTSATAWYNPNFRGKWRRV